MAYDNKGIRPDISFGSHFFQDLVEADIFYTAIFQEEESSYFNFEKFENEKDIFSDILPEKSLFKGIIKLYEIKDVKLIADIKSQNLICYIDNFFYDE